MTPTKYVLFEQGGTIILRCYATPTEKGYFNVEAVKRVTGKSIEGMRKNGKRLAKRWGVPFVNEVRT